MKNSELILQNKEKILPEFISWVETFNPENIIYNKNRIEEDEEELMFKSYENLVGIVEIPRTLIFGLDGVGQDIVCFFCEGQEAKLGIIKEPVDEMELCQHFLPQQFCFIEKDLMVFKVIDIFYLEGGHSYFPDHFPGGNSEWYVVRCYECIGRKSRMVILR